MFAARIPVTVIVIERTISKHKIHHRRSFPIFGENIIAPNLADCNRKVFVFGKSFPFLPCTERKIPICRANCGFLMVKRCSFMHRAVQDGNLLPCGGGAFLSCVDKKGTKEATRGGTAHDPFATSAVSRLCSPDQNRPPRVPSRHGSALVVPLCLAEIIICSNSNLSNSYAPHQSLPCVKGGGTAKP